MNRPRFWLLAGTFLTLGWLLVQGLALELTRVRSVSMMPTLRPGQWVRVDRWAYGLRLAWGDSWLAEWAEPRRGEVVVLVSPADGQRLVKRVVGVGGDVVEGVAVPEGWFFVRGDHIEQSLDSRHFGPVPRRALIGRVALASGGP